MQRETDGFVPEPLASRSHSQLAKRKGVRRRLRHARLGRVAALGAAPLDTLALLGQRSCATRAPPRDPFRVANAGVRSNGEGGIRTRDGDFAPYSLSRRVPSATRPPLREGRLSVKGAYGDVDRRAAPCRRAIISCLWRGGRAVECDGLENRCAGDPRTQGSNPCPSAWQAAHGKRRSWAFATS